MKLSEKKLQELKKKKTSIEDLDEKYFIESYKVEVENILKLLNENVCDFKYIVERFHKASQMNYLLKNEELFDEIIENGALTEDVAKFTFDRFIRSVNVDLQVLDKNLSLITYLIGSDIISFHELVDAYTSQYIDQYSDSLCYLLENERLFESLVKNNKLNKEDLRFYLLNKIDDEYELSSLNKNTFLSGYIISENIVSFQFLIEKYKKIVDDAGERCLYKMFYNEKLFERLLESGMLYIEDLKYLLNEVSSFEELNALCRNTLITKWFLDDFLLEKTFICKKFIDKFSTITKNDKWCKNRNIRTVFDLIEENFVDERAADDRVLKLNALSKFVYESDLSEAQELMLAEILKTNESTQDKLFQILKNNLEDTYNFESLKNLLTKDEEKKKIKLNI